MLAKAIETPVMTEAQHKASFFRQSGWMIITAVGGGLVMFLVNFLSSKFISPTEYQSLAVLFQLLNCVVIPAIGLQTTFAQQTSAALTDAEWYQFLRCVVGAFREAMHGFTRATTGLPHDDPPF